MEVGEDGTLRQVFFLAFMLVGGGGGKERSLILQQDQRAGEVRKVVDCEAGVVSNVQLEEILRISEMLVWLRFVVLR